MSLYLLENGIEHVRVFADTGWEHPATYEYLRGPLTKALGPIVEVRGDRTFAELVRHKRIFPDRTKRFCTDLLKVKPIKAYIDSLDAYVVNAIGVRREESHSRRNVPDWEESRSLDVQVWRPIAAWTRDDVIEIHRRHGLSPNPLYALGAHRVGCWPCIHARQEEIVLVADTDPSRIDEIRALETDATELARQHADAEGKDLKWQRSMFSIRESAATAGDDGVVRRRHLPLLIDDAVAWARRGVARRETPQMDLFSASCGEWGFCES